ncbi:MAG: transketolase [Bacilli bacterium]|jgi:transketolase|nr:transketolase [Bacilli bacterium]
MYQKQPLSNVDDLAVAAIRSLVIDETNQAKSGHPGMALDIAPTLYLLFRNHLVSDPAHPEWVNRDRFVLSSGHNSALLYALLHVCGYGLTIDDLRKFRQFDSLTPGHPEYGRTVGVDATAGPLGQGISQAVGMAMAERAVAASYRGDEAIMSHFTYCLCGDGCLEEGLSQEAISLAGLHKLEKLVLIYDENGSTLDGPTSASLIEDEGLRFQASGWRVIEVRDGNDLASVDEAIEKAKTPMGKPTLIIVHTIIGYGTSLAGNHKCHGNPLGLDEGAKAKANYGYGYPPFTVPAEVYDLLKATFAARGREAYGRWQGDYAAFRNSHPGEAIRFGKAFRRETEEFLPPEPEYVSEASRRTSGKIVASLHDAMPFTLGGSADVASSVMTAIPGDPGFSHEHPEAHNVNFGIREFAMAGAQNGMLLHGGLVTYVGCFLIFSDYMKNAIRMSALERVPAIYLFSHDSIAVGEDGPTHEPVEQLTALRTIPGIHVIRPADARETYGAWRIALLSKNTPNCLILSRQTLPLLERSEANKVGKGAYIVYPNDKATVQFLATGSEVSLAIEAAKIAKEKGGLEAEVVSMPCLELFEEQDEAYKASVLRLPKISRCSFEMGSGAMWYRYADHVYSIESFGKSAPASQVLDDFGFTPAKAAAWALGLK